jgi:P2 family phage contractile tail tube protein
MSNLPRFILRNCTLWADRQSKLGQIGDITVPVPSEKLEEMRNAGMVKPREIKMGLEKTEFSFKMPGLDPHVIKLFGLKPGVETPFMVTGALVDETGEDHSAVLTIRGFLKSANGGTWTPGERAENDYAVAVHYYKLEIDGENLIEVDDFDVKVGGVSQYAGQRASMLI